jgi:XTP/dITP diphosphohydrolase
VARLVLIDTAEQLPGLLPLHAWTALMSSELVLLGSADHPFSAHLHLADLRYEVVEAPGETASLTRVDLLAGISPEEKRRAERIVDIVQEHGEAAYLLGAGETDAFTRTLGMEAANAGVEVEVVYFTERPKGVALLDLVRVEERLRGPDGCPWDREQTHESLGRYAVEEVYELLEAISIGDPDSIREELGDVLLQVVFHAQIAEDAGTFTIDDVARGISGKLVRRHPHVFGDVQVADADEVMANWEELKAAEKPDRDLFEGIPPAQPALGYVGKLQARAAKTGFDWNADAEAADRIRAELDELQAATAHAERVREVGDLLMSVVGLARRYEVDPETALRGAARRFRTRFEAMAMAADRPFGELSRAEWLHLWEQAKAGE